MKVRNRKDQVPRKPRVPTTGEGADSALEALKKKRLPAPGDNPPGPPAKKAEPSPR